MEKCNFRNDQVCKNATSEIVKFGMDPNLQSGWPLSATVIMAHGIKFENGTYTSKLEITLNSELYYGKTVSCFYDNGSVEISVGKLSLQMEKLGKQLQKIC